ncbi:MAG: ATP-grasp domain-containing protein [Candidatus Sericytochromatia bacterium]|nr:ATP-grasp domain-containing protein [Candidatus Sericytochromatia bacterium]
MSQAIIPFDTVLIANRGEIACRIIRACRELGLGTVAVYSEADRHSLHVQLADQAVYLGPAPASESYLKIPALLAAAHATGAQALHPGYGFLAENPELADACARSGLVFVGPSANVLRELGAKTTARDRALALGIPVVPGQAIDPDQPEACQALANHLGYPLLVKAVGGGGGRGMRRIANQAELLPALASAAAEALKAFSDHRLYLEKLLEPVRHIEFQILGDSQGQVIHLGERECSLQRRYQKIWEEAPAVNFSSELRQAMGADAVKLGSSLSYVGAGTVEFILDSQDQYYFLEVNPRIQVEHPVTEAITGLDLVQLQLKLAAGEPLPLSQSELLSELQASGHAIEVRICCEDPSYNFAPASGKMAQWQLPNWLRIDSGITAGAEIGIDYDSLLAKLIIHAPTRQQALSQLRRALSESVALGLPTNIPFLMDLCAEKDLVAGRVHTGWLEAQLAALSQTPAAQAKPPLALLAAATAWQMQMRPRDPLQAAGLPIGWRNNPSAPQREHWGFWGQRFTVTYHQIGQNKLAVNLTSEADAPEEMTLHLIEADAEKICFEYQNLRYLCRVWQNGEQLWLHHRSWGNLCLDMLPRLRRPAAQTQAGDLCAVLPGKVLKIEVSLGQHVAEGDPLLVMESMKMETRLNAPFAGVVHAVCVSPLQQVSAGQKLLEISPPDSNANS